MKIIYLVPIFIILCISSCSNELDKTTLKKMLRSGNEKEIIDARKYISNNKDTGMVGAMLEDAFDPRITHILLHKGMSMYQIKMGAMKLLL